MLGRKEYDMAQATAEELKADFQARPKAVSKILGDVLREFGYTSISDEWVEIEIRRLLRQTLARNHIELLVPLKSKEQLTGVLFLGNKLPGETYSTENGQLSRKASSEVAASIENACLYENVQRAQRKLKKTMEGVIHALSLTVEARDPYTARHQRRVTGLACAIAGEMGLPEWRIEGMRITGLLHDVGKIVVPAEILSKPGKLSQYEFSIIKTHPEVGYEILKEIEFPWPVTQAILQHHERLDGSGYPAGLSGKDIILEARILGVTDVVEAMSSHRPYRPALGLDSALEEISKKRGILYDPEVVDACLKIFTEKGFKFEQEEQVEHQAVVSR